ncbi:MAG: MFS transporter, partial [Candidatus Cloacimonadaceae bacterium]|nr:MFS transporter [Candidatus Cloacimonadaceae bacterium]
FLQSSVLAMLVLMDFIHAGLLWPLIVLSLLQGVIEAIDAPVRQSYVIDLVGTKSMLPNAIAMNSAMFNGARLIGPSVAGLLIVFFNEGFCFAFNALSYIPVLIMLFLIRVKYDKSPPRQQSMLRNVLEGFSYAWQNLPIRFLISNIVIFTLFGMSYATLLPVFARDVLMGDSRTLGMMMSTAGIGALLGALYLASRQSIRGLGQRMVMAGVIVSMCLIFFAFSKSLIFSMGLILFIGLGMMLQMASTNTIIQAVVDDRMRGRVLSLYTMAYMSIAPFGSLLAGSISSRIGVKHTLMASASICLIWGLYGLSFLPKFVRNVQRMLILNKNQEIYRPVGAVLNLGMRK